MTIQLKQTDRSSLEWAHIVGTNQGYKLLREYRDQQVCDIPIKDWFSKRCGCSEAWEILESLRLIRDGAAIHVCILDKESPILTLDASDNHYNTLSHESRQAFNDLELQRRKYGVWINMPSFDRDNTEHIENRTKNPFFGRVRLLSGSHYFGLIYLKLVDVKTSDLIYPIFNRKSAQLLDVLEILHDYPIGDVNSKNREGILVFKPRGVKFTSDVNSFLINKLTFNNFYRVASMIDEDSKCAETLEEKVFAPMRTIPRWYGERLVPEKEASQAGNAVLRFSYSENPKHPRSKNQTTKMSNEWRESTSSYTIKGPKPKKFESARANVVYSDEINKYEYEIARTLTNGRALLLDSERNVSGLFIGGGTSDSFNKNAADIEKMGLNPKLHGLFTFFIGKQHHNGCNPETGWADEEKCIEEELETRKKLEEDGSEEFLIAHCMTEAISIEDCFFAAGETMLNKNAINLQIRKVNSSIEQGEIIIQRGWFHPTWQEIERHINSVTKETKIWTKADLLKPYFVPDPNGGWRIVEHPDPNKLKFIGGKTGIDYFAGSDNLNKILSIEDAKKVVGGEKKMSLVSMYIMNVFSRAPAAFYLYRGADPKSDFLQTMLACIYWDCYNFIETNKEGQDDFFRENTIFNLIRPGELDNRCLFDTPQKYRTTNTGRQKGMMTGTKKKELYVSHIIPYFEDFVNKIQLREVLEVFVQWDIENTKNTPDLGMAKLMCLIGLEAMLSDKRYAQRSLVQDFDPRTFFKSAMLSEAYMP
jgi:hypothetical protein